MRHPTSRRRRSRPHRPGRRPRPAPGSLPGDRRHQPGKRRAVDLVGPRSCGSPWRPSSRSAGVLPSRIRRKLTRPGQPIAMRNSSTSAIGRTTRRRPSTSAPSSPRSTRSSSPRRQTCGRSRSPRDRRATSNACKDGARPVDGGQKAGRRSYGKERTARTHPHMRLGRGSQRTREGEGPHVRAGTSNTGGRGAGDRPDSELSASHFAIRRGIVAYGVDDAWMSQRDRAELERWVRSPSMPAGLVANKPALVESETSIGGVR